MKFIISLIAFATVCCLVSAAAVDNRGQYQPGQYQPGQYQPGQYYNGRYYKNRDYYNQRRYYDNFYKQYKADVVPAQARIVEQKLEPAVDGNFAYHYETENGIHGEARGRSVYVGGDEPGQKIDGSFAYITPEGVRVGVTYTADENGYRPVYTFDGVDAARYANAQPSADVEITKVN